MVLKIGQSTLACILSFVTMYRFSSDTGHEGVAISFCESEELPYLKDIQKLIGKNIPVVKDHPFVTTEGIKAQEEKQEEIKVKAKANKTYRGSRANGDFWRRKKQKTNQPSSTKQEKRK